MEIEEILKEAKKFKTMRKIYGISYNEECILILAKEINTLQKENEQLNEALKEHHEYFLRSGKENTKLKEENEELREELRKVINLTIYFDKERTKLKERVKALEEIENI